MNLDTLASVERLENRKKYVSSCTSNRLPDRDIALWSRNSRRRGDQSAHVARRALRRCYASMRYTRACSGHAPVALGTRKSVRTTSNTTALFVSFRRTWQTKRVSMDRQGALHRQTYPDHRSHSLWCLPLGVDRHGPKGLDGARINRTNGAECKVLLLVRWDDCMVCRIHLGRCKLVTRCSRFYERHLEAGG
jgi:hypothetical protein